MANRPLLERGVHVRPFRVASLLLAVAVLLAACGGGGGDDRTKVEASLRQYVSTVVPERSRFPLGAGFPRVRENSCKKIPTPVLLANIPAGPHQRALRDRITHGRLSGWSCVVTLGRIALPVVVETKGSSEVSTVFPGVLPPRPPQPTTYEGGP
jgi:hypothetical protein